MLVGMNELRAKAIAGLECCLSLEHEALDELVDKNCEVCPYRNEELGTCDNRIQFFEDILSVLKAQEPVRPYIDYDGQDVWRCGSCGATLFHLSHTQADENEQNCVKFCRYCGKAVKWDG